MNKLIFLVILLCFPLTVSAKGPEDRVREKDIIGIQDEVYLYEAIKVGIVEDLGASWGGGKTFYIKAKEWKDIKIGDRINLRIVDEIGNDTVQARKIKDKVETETSIVEKIKIITEEEILKDVSFYLGVISAPSKELAVASSAPFKELASTIATSLIEIIEAFNVAIVNVKIEEWWGNPGKIAISLRKAKIDENLVVMIEKGLKGEYSKTKLKEFFEGKDNHNAHAITSLSLGWETVWDKKIKNGDMVYFDLALDKDFLQYLLFVYRYKDKIGYSVISWDNEGLNNFDEKDTSKYSPRLAKSIIFYAFCKTTMPDKPVGALVCLTPAERFWAWKKAFPFQPDFWGVWNIYSVNVNFEKVKRLYFPEEDLMVIGMNALAMDENKKENAYEIYIRKIKELGYCGSVWFN